MNQELQTELIQMAKEDEQVRNKLAADGSLFEGYHPKMEVVHKRNAKRLAEIINQYGWPGKSLVGEEGAEAAWLILQHDIGEPNFQRTAIPLLEKAVSGGDVPGAFLAKLVDRICMYEGKPQKYGTQFDWDEHGEMNTIPIADTEQVDKLRKSVDLPPLKESVLEIRQRVEQENQKPPKDYTAYRQSMEKWAQSVGWR